MALATNIQEQNTQGLNGLCSAFAFAAGEITKLSMVNGAALCGDEQDKQNEINAGSAARAGNGELSNTAGTTSAAENYKSQRIGAQDKANEERKRNLWMQQMIALEQRLSEIENQLIETYGDDFADNLLADLNAQGSVSDDEYRDAMSIQDLAELIQEKLDDGTLEPEDLEGHPWAQDWLDAHREVEAARELEARNILNGATPVSEASVSARNEAAASQADTGIKENVLTIEEQNANEESFSSVNSSRTLISNGIQL